MDRALPMCDGCPLEKSPGGLCYEGIWREENQELVFEGAWRCAKYNYKDNECEQGN